ncbi:hypothetical protein ACPCG0_07335 [Propionibacteriaceae bacterium Y1923]
MDEEQQPHEGAVLNQQPANLVIVGAGSYGSVIAEIAAECGFIVGQFLDDRQAVWGTNLDGVPVTGPIERELRNLDKNQQVAVALGDSDARMRYLLIARELQLGTPALISPGATVSPTAVLEEGIILHHGSHVWTHARIEFGSIISVHATVAHHAVLGTGSFVSTAANVGASVHVGERVMVGMNATIITGVRQVAHDGVIGAGSVVIRDTEPYGVYAGSPAKRIRTRSAKTEI